jgi:O-antigen ligase
MSRGFWLVLVCAILLAAALVAMRENKVRKRALVLIAFVCLVALALAALVAMQRGRSLVYLGDRAVIYSAAVTKILENPLTGAGYGYETDKPWYAAAMPGWSVFHPHNIVLSYIDQMGFLGVLALIMLFGAPSWVLWRAFHSPSREARVAALCGLVMVASVFVKNNLDYFFWKQNLWLFFAHLGIYFGAIDRALGASPQGGR